MDQFVLMQEPAKWVTEKKGYFTIGLKKLYPNRGFSSCDEYGNTDYVGPTNSSSDRYFAFLDKESEKKFKGEIRVIPEMTTMEEVKFAVVKLKES
jgi:hypothetical protein